MDGEEKILKSVYKTRKKDSHKYNFGHLLVIGGSKKYSGSPALASLAAYRTGVDLVTTFAPRRAADIIATFSPNLITVPLEGSYFREEHIKEIKKIKNFSAVVIGGGLERRKETMDAVNKFLKTLDKPCVIDADAIYAVSKNKKVLRRKPFVLTPHSYEFFVLSGIRIERFKGKKAMEIVKKVASSLKTTILLKGNPDVISNGEKVVINKTGNPYMTVGGTGDVLAGILGSLLAQGVDTFEAARLAAYINGKVGDLVAKTKKEALTATDMINNLYRVLRD